MRDSPGEGALLDRPFRGPGGVPSGQVPLRAPLKSTASTSKFPAEEGGKAGGGVLAEHQKGQKNGAGRQQVAGQPPPPGWALCTAPFPFFHSWHLNVPSQDPAPLFSRLACLGAHGGCSRVFLSSCSGRGTSGTTLSPSSSRSRGPCPSPPRTSAPTSSTCSSSSVPRAPARRMFATGEGAPACPVAHLLR